MSHRGRKHPSFPDLVAPLDDEGSSVRAREAAATEQGSAPAIAEAEPAAPPTRRPHPSTRPPTGSLDERLERKQRIAMQLTQGLPATDARVRLLRVAIIRRDETLLDGVLAELNKPRPRG